MKYTLDEILCQNNIKQIESQMRILQNTRDRLFIDNPSKWAEDTINISCLLGSLDAVIKMAKEATK